MEENELSLEKKMEKISENLKGIIEKRKQSKNGSEHILEMMRNNILEAIKFKVSVKEIAQSFADQNIKISQTALAKFCKETRVKKKKS
jgi:hypothetical protein